jgi:hypothetical protein
MGEVRVSAASLVKIDLDGKYLVGLNKGALKSGKRVYTPFGGALEFFESARFFLEGIGANFEKGNDLRFTIPERNLSAFESWFYAKRDRELSPYRELEEELVKEEKIFLEMPSYAVNLEHLGTYRDRSCVGRFKPEGRMTQRYFEVFHANFAPKYIEWLRLALEKDNTPLMLVSEDEIASGLTSSGLEIGSNCIYLVKK